MASERRTVENICRKLWLLICAAKLLGMLPWTIKGERITRAGICGRIYTMIFFAFCSLVFLKSVYGIALAGLVMNPHEIFSQLLTTAATSEILMNLYLEITDAEVFETLSQYDRTVELLGRRRSDSSLIFWIMATPMIAYVLVTLKMLVNNEYRDRPSGVIGVLLIRYLIISVYVAVLKFCIMADLLRQRYRHLNDIVVPIATTIDTEESSVRPEVTIHDVIRLHAMLVKVTRTLADVYSGQILLWCSGFVNTVLQVVKAAITLGETVHGVVQVLQNLVQVITICWACHSAAFQANKLGFVLLKTNQKFKRSFDSAVAIDAAMYVYNHRISFTAGNLYDVNLTTILMLSQITLNFALLVFK